VIERIWTAIDAQDDWQPLADWLANTVLGEEGGHG
jgi:hypothetical protein